MQVQWEYIMATIAGPSLVEGLNKLGADGWQAVTIERRPDDTLVVLKRPKPIVQMPNFGVDLRTPARKS